ncbi:MAG: hypothetical protein GF313_03385 [Caldithrix sp.]|nr:hypothetical protein [Caldithrix sp.]
MKGRNKIQRMLTYTGVLFFLVSMTTVTTAQVRVAVGSFANNSDDYYLDAWENRLPDLLSADLAGFDGIIILERGKLEDVINEQKLALTGLVDSSTAQEVGKLMNAEFIVNGTIERFSDQYRIDARLIRVKTGETHVETVFSGNAEHLNLMSKMLANNLRHQLTHKGNYQYETTTGNWPTAYFLMATIGFSAGSFYTNDKYLHYNQKYDDAHELGTFDKNYDKANQARKITIALGVTAGVSLMGTLLCWLRNKTSNTIQSKSNKNLEIKPSIGHMNSGEFGIALRYHF